MTSYPIVQHLERSATEKALLRPHLKYGKTDPRAWKRGTIIRVPHVEPIVPSNHAPDPNHIPWVEDISIVPRIRLAVIVAVFRSSMITLPIFDQRTRDYEYTRLRTTSMHIKPRSKKLYEAEPLPDPTDRSLYIRGSYEPEPEAYLELTRPLSVEFSWPFHYVDYLDAVKAPHSSSNDIESATTQASLH
ncbi:hypothetical protein LTR64_007017 [Lithohypha guttulata]|uniref:uncharacterized protein n=1 Tax=Lithohypha guttulata TaxID=1690604 RepID=UPI002DE19E1D|nr:hypothetical protein LTR51_004426 [Lithohypha guttulata]